MAVEQRADGTLVIDGYEVTGEWGKFLEFRLETDPLESSLLERVRRLPGGDSILKCWQCGTCTAGCTVNGLMDKFNPRHMIELVRLGDLQELKELANEAWRCTSCQKCTHRCPKGVNTNDGVQAIIALLIEEGVYPKPFTYQVYGDVFIDHVMKNGRIEESQLAKDFYTKMGRASELVKQAGTGLKLVFSGRAKIFGGHKVKNWDKVRGVLEKHRAHG